MGSGGGRAGDRGSARRLFLRRRFHATRDNRRGFDAARGFKGTLKLKEAPITLPELAAQLKAGAQGVTSEHITISESVGGQSGLSLEGDETWAAGKLTAMRLDEKLEAIKLTMRFVDRSLYVKLPASLNQGRKPWAKATVGSTDPVLSRLASSISSIEQSASQQQYGALAESGDSLITVAVEQINQRSLRPPEVGLGNRADLGLSIPTRRL
jgi:hypothetical protein